MGDVAGADIHFALSRLWSGKENDALLKVLRVDAIDDGQKVLASYTFFAYTPFNSYYISSPYNFGVFQFLVVQDSVFLLTLHPCQKLNNAFLVALL